MVIAMAEREVFVVLEHSTATNNIYLTPLDTAVTLCNEAGCVHNNSNSCISDYCPPAEPSRMAETQY